jgi:hypothetical protein
MVLMGVLKGGARWRMMSDPRGMRGDMSDSVFEAAFRAFSGKAPFPSQRELFPRRLVLVDRRTVVDLATKEATRSRSNLEIPAFKFRGQSRIKRTEFEHWIDAMPRGRDGGRHGK